MLRARAEADEYDTEKEKPVRHSTPGIPDTGDGEKRVSDTAMMLHLAGDIEYARTAG